MRQASNIYVIGISAIAFLASSCGVETNATQTTASQDVSAMEKHPKKESSSSISARSSPAPKIEPIPVGKITNAKSDRAVTVEKDDFQSENNRDSDRSFSINDHRQAIESSAAYRAVKSQAEEIYNDAARKNEHDRMCEQASMLLSTGSSDAEKVNAFCMAVDAYIQKKMTQEITTAIGSSESNQETISRDNAIATVKKYLKAKSQLYAPPFNKNLGAELLTGSVYRDRIDKNDPNCNNPDDCLSSIDWLIKYDAQYSYGTQRIDSIDSFESNGDTATLVLTITESRTLHQRGKKKRSGETSRTTFDLVEEDGSIKIADIRSN